MSDMLSPMVISRLINDNRPAPLGVCSVCGEELTLSSSDDGGTYHCSSGDASLIRAGELDKQEGNDSLSGENYKRAREHRDRSQVKNLRYGDPQVLALALENRRLREDRGEDMSVPEGSEYYPYGHGRHRCWRRDVHLGGDRWVTENDLDLLHDPTHATLEAEGD